MSYVELSEEHRLFQKTVRDFVDEVIKPRAKEIDEAGEFPWWCIEELRKMGLMGVPYGEEWGGAGGDTLMYAIAIEEISRASGSIGLLTAAHISLGTGPIYNFGTDEQKKKYLPKLCSGQVLGAFCLTEPQAGSDAGGTRTVAVQDGDHWVINGAKNWITNAGVADVFIVTAVTDKGQGTDGISSFIVEKGMPGLKTGKKEDKLGLRGSETNPVFFEDVRVSNNAMLGPRGKGFKQFMKTLDGGRISIGAMAVGLAQAAMEASLEYAQTREQFNRPIGHFQAIQFKLADMATEIAAARHLVYDSAVVKDAGGNFTRLSAMAKLFASEVAMRATTQAIQVYGGNGYSTEYPVERFFRDAKLCEIGEGTSEIQRMVIARELMKEYPVRR
ncbi:MAG TPA: acyl-CoA dehydrogenase [Candidatus Eisenbacteria bacterium]